MKLLNITFKQNSLIVKLPDARIIWFIKINYKSKKRDLYSQSLAYTISIMGLRNQYILSYPHIKTSWIYIYPIPVKIDPLHYSNGKYEIANQTKLWLLKLRSVWNIQIPIFTYLHPDVRVWFSLVQQSSWGRFSGESLPGDECEFCPFACPMNRPTIRTWHAHSSAMVSTYSNRYQSKI